MKEVLITMGVDNLLTHTDLSSLLPIIILYIGPETILPLTSALAAVAGVLLMFWQRLVLFVRKIWRILGRKDAE
jgi:hypothetical protein